MGDNARELLVAQERLRLVFEHAQNGLLLADETGAVIDCNPAALAILGMTDKAQLVGRRPAEFSPSVQPDGVASSVKSKMFGMATRERGSMDFEWTHQRVDGTLVTLDVSVKHAHVDGRQFSVVRWHDLTRRVEVEAEREVIAQKLAQSQKLEAVGQLAGGIAHDFNNLLAGTRNALELALSALNDREAIADDVRLALENTERAAGLTRQLLTISRHQPIATTELDWRLIITRALPFLRSIAPPEILWEIDVPDEPVYVRANASQLDQVLLNLVINARDAMRGGGRIDIVLHVHEQRAVLSVRDHGVGMDASIQARIFEPFFTTKAVGQGSGLGLSVVYGLVKGWGGEVAVESTPQEGSTFRVRLPVAARAPDARDSAAVVHRAGPGAGRVLLVEDTEAVRTTTRRLLVRAGWVVEEAEDGEVAWERLLASPMGFDVVLSDVRMPRLDGVRLVERMRRNDYHIPVVFMSGFDHIEYPFPHGVADVPLLPKPFSSTDLLEILQKARL